MPILSPRHEKFAELLAQGKSARESYVLCGYRDNRHNAARLKSSEHIARRVLEIQAAGAKSAEVSVASLLQELEDARAQATTLGQLSAAVRATAEKAKISGLMVQKVEVEVSQPEPEPQHAQEVLHRIANRVDARGRLRLELADRRALPRRRP